MRTENLIPHRLFRSTFCPCRTLLRPPPPRPLCRYPRLCVRFVSCLRGEGRNAVCETGIALAFGMTLATQLQKLGPYPVRMARDKNSGQERTLLSPHSEIAQVAPVLKRKSVKLREGCNRPDLTFMCPASSPTIICLPLVPRHKAVISLFAPPCLPGDCLASAQRSSPVAPSQTLTAQAVVKK